MLAEVLKKSRIVGGEVKRIGRNAPGVVAVVCLLGIQTGLHQRVLDIGANVIGTGNHRL